MMRSAVFLFVTVAFMLECSVAGNSWARQLRRAVKRSHDAKQAGRSGLAELARSALLGAESGGYSLKQHLTPTRPTPNTYASICYGQPPGSYGDPEYSCKAFHVCQADGRFDKMDCPASLRFNNYLGVCDWPYQVDAYCNPLYPVYQYSGPSQDNSRSYEENKYQFHPDPEMNYAAAEVRSSITPTDAMHADVPQHIPVVEGPGVAPAEKVPLLA